MAIDPSIALNVKQAQIDNPLDAYAKVAQFKQMQQQNRLADLMFGEKQREVEESNTLNRLYKESVGADGQIDRNKLYTRVAQGGLGAKLPAIQKTFADQDKSMIESQKAKLETGLKQFEAVSQIMSGVKDQASYDVARQEIAALVGPEAAAKIHPVYDPAVIEQNKIKALSVKDQMEQRWKELDYKLNTDKFAYQQKHDATTLAETVRNNNMSDARGRQANALKAQEVKAVSLSQPFEVSGADGNPVLVQQDKRSGQLIPVQGFKPKDGGGTEGERTASGYGLRMAEAEKIIGDVSTKNPKAQKPGLIEKAVGPGMVANMVSSDDRQLYRQAQEDWVRAKLRKESGAVIGEEEMEREIQTYFPQKGDGDAVIKQKAKARQVAMEAMKTSAGKAAKSIPAAASPNIDDLLKKYGG